MPPAVGIDFGTTNTALAVCTEAGRTELAVFATADGEACTFRSILHVRRDGERQVTAGPDALTSYLASEGEGRLIQSLKSFLASGSFTSTSIFGKTYTLEDLVGCLLSRVRESAEARFGPLGTAAVVGRPVRFAESSGPEDDERAVTRLTGALGRAGFHDVRFVPEPVAAAWEYRRRLRGEATCFIADFGGGTTDFSLLRVSPSGAARTVATAGVARAGDAFDGRLVEHVVSAPFGLGSTHRSSLGKRLPMPLWIYRHLERWHHVSFLKSPATIRFLREAARTSDARHQLEALLHVIERDLGFALHSAVQDTKLRLSDAERAHFAFADPPALVEADVARAAFEEWIRPELAVIRDCYRDLMVEADVAFSQVDSVFLTGGSAFVPAVRRLFAEDFGREKLRGGEELTTVARGLALHAAERR